MQILFISNVVPAADGGGLPQRMAMHLRALQMLGDVTLIVPPQDDTPGPVLPGAKTIVRGPTIADLRRENQHAARSRLARAWYGWRRLNMIDARANPADVARFASALRGTFDLVFAGRLGNAVWWESIAGREARRGEMRIVDFDDIESRMLEKWIGTISVSPFWTWKLHREVAWLRRLERRVAQTWNAVLLCSRVDSGRLLEATGTHAWIVPNSYDLKPIVPERIGPKCNLLFVGSFEYFPNAQGIEWFLASIWPHVREALGQTVRLTLVGLNAPPWIEALASRPEITVASNVPSVDPFYDEANLVIAPLLAGSGTRIKLIEAAAKGRAIVTTTLGCEGLGFEEGVHAEIADDPADFAARIVALARDPARRGQLAKAARAHAMQEFSADVIVAALAAKVRAALAQKLSNPEIVPPAAI